MNPFGRRNLFQTLAGGLLVAAATPAAQIPDQVVPKAKAKLNAQPFGDLRVYLDGETGQLKGLTVGSLELQPGQSPHPPHSHSEEEIMLITEGQGEITLDNKVTPVGPGAVMYAASNRVHGIVNTSKAPMRFYYIKWIAK